MGYHGLDKILRITLVSSKKLGVYKKMRNTVDLYNISKLKRQGDIRRHTEAFESL